MGYAVILASDRVEEIERRQETAAVAAPWSADPAPTPNKQQPVLLARPEA